MKTRIYAAPAVKGLNSYLITKVLSQTNSLCCLWVFLYWAIQNNILFTFYFTLPGDADASDSGDDGDL